MPGTVVSDLSEDCPIEIRTSGNDRSAANIASAPPRAWRVLEVVGLAIAILVLIVFRFHAFDLPLETDECNYAYIAARLLEGGRLYIDVWDHQPPGVFVLFAGVIALFGDGPMVFRSTAAAFSLASLLLVHAIVRRIGGRLTGVAAAMLFAIVSSDPGTGGEGANREIYMNTLILAAWYFAMRWADAIGRDGIERARADTSNHDGNVTTVTSRAADGAWLWLLAAGSALALGSSVKTVVAIHWVVLAVAVGCIAGCSGGGASRTRYAGSAVVFLGLGPAALWLLTWLYFIVTGRAAEFADAVFLFNLSYSEGGGGFLSRFTTFFRPPRHPFIFDSAFPLWIAAATGSIVILVTLVKRLGAGAERIRHESAPTRSDQAIAGPGLILCLVVAGFFAVCLPGRFWPHYYYLLIPPAVIATAVAVALIASRLTDWAQRPSAARVGGGVLLVGIALAVLAAEYRHYLSQPLFGITVNRYNSRDFWGRAQGESVGRVTRADDRVFVYGNEAEIYYYSGRRCASRYTMITGLSEGMAGAEDRRKILMDELRSDPPRLILIVFDQPPFDEWLAFLDTHYGEPIGFDFHDRTGEPIMFVMARKDQPIEPIDWNWDRSSVGGWFAGDRSMR